LVGVDALRRRLPENLGQPLLHRRHARLPADQQQLVDVLRLELRVVHHPGEDGDGAVDQLAGDVLEHLAGEDEVDVERLALRRHGDERHGEGRLLAAAEIDLHPLGEVLDPLHRHRIGGEIDAVLLREVVQHVLDHRLVEVEPAEEDVAAGRLHLEHAVADLDDGDVEGAPSEVVDHHSLVQVLADPVGEGGGGGLVDDPHHLQLDQLPRVLHRLALPVGEVGGHGHHRARHLLSQVVLRDHPDLVQDLCADLGEAKVLVPDVEHHVVPLALLHLVGDGLLHQLHHVAAVGAPDETLGRVHGIARIELPLALRLVADQLVALVVDGEDRGDDELSPLVGNELDRAVLDDGGATVRGAEVDSDDLAHEVVEYTMVDSLRYLKSVGDQVRRTFVANKTILAFQEYMEAFFEAPRVHARDAAQYIRDCFDFYGTETIQRPPGSVRRFKLFDRPFDQTPGVQEGEGGAPVIGQEEVQNAIYRILHSFVRAGRVHKLILLHGPNGSAKSSIVGALQRALEDYSRKEEGALYRLNWIFPNERLVKGSIGFGEKLGGVGAVETYAHLEGEQID